MLKNSNKTGLKKKIFTFFISFILIGISSWALGLFFVYFFGSKIIKETIGSNFQTLAIETSKKLELMINQYTYEVRTLAGSEEIIVDVEKSDQVLRQGRVDDAKVIEKVWPSVYKDDLQVRRFTKNRAAERLKKVLRSDIVEIIVTNEKGILLAATEKPAHYYYGDEGWWRSTFSKRKTILSDIFFSKERGGYFFAVSSPIIKNERPIGVIRFTYDVELLSESVISASIGETEHTMLVSSDGTLLFCPIFSIGTHNLKDELKSAIFKNTPGWAATMADIHYPGKDAINGYSPVNMTMTMGPENFGGKNWYIFTSQDPDETYKPVWGMLKWIAIAGISGGVLGLGMMFLLGFVLIQRIVRPINLLQEKAELIGQGNLDCNIDIHTGDEIESLAAEFKKMAANLKRSLSDMAFQRSEMRYQDLVENSPEMIHQIDKDLKFVHVNKTELERLGYTLDEIKDVRLIDIVPPDHRDRISEYLMVVMKEGEARVETIFITKDGEQIDVELSATAQYDPNTGEFIATRGFTRDISERKRLEEERLNYTVKLEQEVAERTRELADSEKKYRSLFDFAEDSMMRINREGKIFAVNKREEWLIGYKEEELLGKELTTILPEGYWDEFGRLLRVTIDENKKVPTSEVEVIRNDGRLIPMELDFSGISEDDNVVAVQVHFRDISTRKVLQQQVERYREALEAKVEEVMATKDYLESLLENAEDVIYTLDLNGKFTYLNKKVGDWGYKREDLEGRSFLSITADRNANESVVTEEWESCPFIGTIDGGRNRYDMEILTKAGDIRYTTINASPLRDKEGKIIGILGIARDITEKRHLEQKVRQSERLAAIGQLAAGLAHEINNPLGGIFNCLYNIKKGGLTPQKKDEYIGYMEDAIQRVKKIVSELLDFSQMKELKLSMVNPNKLIEDVIQSLDYAIKEKSIRIERLPSRKDLSIMLDKGRMEQVLANLVLNSIQAVDINGIISFRTDAEDQHCLIEISDNGAGIHPEVLPKIFDPFFTTKDVGKGAGLGLSVSRGIIERHNGNIEVSSEIGKGTSFKIKLPLRSWPERNSLSRSDRVNMGVS
ncbi:MAG: PAS domain S-box protein [Nitrospirae bacterium]|nr:PAS domain S-box protein [Nitrospirota bacterium]